MRRTQQIGFILWRGGLAIVAAYALYEAARWVLRWVALPPQVELGLALLLAGAALVLLSLMLEQWRDSEIAGDLRQ